MNHLKSMKGITIVSLIISIIILLILTGTIINNINSSDNVDEYNNMIADIKLLNDKILIYFNKYGEIPRTIRQVIIGDTYYYEIDLSKLDNITLNHGKDYGKQEDIYENLSDVYVVNNNLELYYLKGIEMNGTKYYN